MLALGEGCPASSEAWEGGWWAWLHSSTSSAELEAESGGEDPAA